jgi:orotidine-5'-phosphate decarboxylase
MSDTLLNIVPGISLTEKGDDKGQHYSSLKERDFADVFVIGRSIINSECPVSAIKKYINYSPEL